MNTIINMFMPKGAFKLWANERVSVCVWISANQVYPQSVEFLMFQAVKIMFTGSFPGVQRHSVSVHSFVCLIIQSFLNSLPRVCLMFYLLPSSFTSDRGS